jgi:hypothetical protein
MRLTAQLWPILIDRSIMAHIDRSIVKVNRGSRWFQGQSARGHMSRRCLLAQQVQPMNTLRLFGRSSMVPNHCGAFPMLNRPDEGDVNVDPSCVRPLLSRTEGGKKPPYADKHDAPPPPVSSSTSITRAIMTSSA